MRIGLVCIVGLGLGLLLVVEGGKGNSKPRIKINQNHSPMRNTTQVSCFVRFLYRFCFVGRKDGIGFSSRCSGSTQPHRAYCLAATKRKGEKERFCLSD
uniref:Putative secreted protein n=1 Tax=Anopheles triannulatus TaxID=58253 RepID=A0A2M4B5Y4_9DIPT